MIALFSAPESAAVTSLTVKYPKVNESRATAFRNYEAFSSLSKRNLRQDILNDLYARLDPSKTHIQPLKLIAELLMIDPQLMQHCSM